MANRQRNVVIAARDLAPRTGFVTGDLALLTGKALLARPVRTSLFVAGLLVFFFVQGLTPPPDRVAAYESKLPTAREADSIARLESKVENARQTYYASQGWFWSCSGPCVTNRARFDALSAELSDLMRQWHDRVSDAKAELGPFSVQAIAETRAYFWRHIADGWRIATDVSFLLWPG